MTEPIISKKEFEDVKEISSKEKFLSNGGWSSYEDILEKFKNLNEIVVNINVPFKNIKLKRYKNCYLILDKDGTIWLKKNHENL